MSQEDATQDDKKKLPELAKEKAARVRQHLKDNRKVYLVGAGCLATGYLLRSNSTRMKQVLENRPRNIGLLYKSSQVINNTVVQEMVRQGEPGKKTYWVEKGIWFPSRMCAAKAANVSITSVSKVCDGLLESVKGQHFVDGGTMI